MFEVSENYRKYLVEFITVEQKLYSVWGTYVDETDDKDYLLASNKKLICFENPQNIRLWIGDRFRDVFDMKNFLKWCKEESLDKPYSQIDFTLMINFNDEIVSNKERALNLLDGLNILQDFFEQVSDNTVLKVIESSDIANLKDFIYSKHFWKGEQPSKFKNGIHLNSLLKILYNKFVENIQVVDKFYGRISGG